MEGPSAFKVCHHSPKVGAAAKWALNASSIQRLSWLTASRPTNKLPSKTKVSRNFMGARLLASLSGVLVPSPRLKNFPANRGGKKWRALGTSGRNGNSVAGMPCCKHFSPRNFPCPASGAPRGMKIGKNRGWTLMDADIPDACRFFLHPRLSVSIRGSNFLDEEDEQVLNCGPWWWSMSRATGGSMWKIFAP